MKILLATLLAATAEVTPAGLRTEHLVDPIGIDVTEPRLSWRMDNPAHPGYQQCLIHPVIPGDLTHARASAESPHGTIVSEWTRADGRLKLKLEIPPNSSATLRIPTSAPASFGGGGKNLPAGLTLVRQDPRHIVLTAPSGRYQLDVPMAD